jgi:hypothetical protein
MARIVSYPLQNVVVGTDKWIGSDMVNDGQTKNFSADAVAVFLNTFNKIEVNALKYRFQNWVTGQTREPGTISFATSNIGGPPFNTISSFMLSKFQLASLIDVSSYYTVPLVGSTVVISQADDPSKFAIYTWNSAAQNAQEPNFFDIGVTLQASTGSLINNKDYFISLLTYASASSGDKNFVFSQDVASATWSVTHNLNKYPSVSVVNSANITVYGDVDYDSLNSVTITFNAAHTGKAFLN